MNGDVIVAAFGGGDFGDRRPGRHRRYGRRRVRRRYHGLDCSKSRIKRECCIQYRKSGASRARGWWRWRRRSEWRAWWLWRRWHDLVRDWGGATMDGTTFVTTPPARVARASRHAVQGNGGDGQGGANDFTIDGNVTVAGSTTDFNGFVAYRIWARGRWRHRRLRDRRDLDDGRRREFTAAGLVQAAAQARGGNGGSFGGDLRAAQHRSRFSAVLTLEGCTSAPMRAGSVMGLAGLVCGRRECPRRRFDFRASCRNGRGDDHQLGDGFGERRRQFVRRHRRQRAGRRCACQSARRHPSVDQ